MCHHAITIYHSSLVCVCVGMAAEIRVSEQGGQSGDAEEVCRECRGTSVTSE